MNRRALPLSAALVAVALLAGCASHPAVPRTSAPEATAAVTPLVTPTSTPEEVTRSTLSGGTVTDPLGPMPATGQIAVDVACWGSDGSTVTWRLVAADGTALGLSGVADCSGPPTTSWLGVTTDSRPKSVRVTLDASSGAVSGYAIVRQGTP